MFLKAPFREVFQQQTLPQWEPALSEAVSSLHPGDAVLSELEEARSDSGEVFRLNYLQQQAAHSLTKQPQLQSRASSSLPEPVSQNPVTSPSEVALQESRPSVTSPFILSSHWKI